MHAKCVIAFIREIPFGVQSKNTNNLIDVLKSLNERAIAQNLTNEMLITTISTIIWNEYLSTYICYASDWERRIVN